MDMGFVKIAALSPRTIVSNPAQNAETALKAIFEADKNGAQIIVLPELYLSAYTCADLFYQTTLLKDCESALQLILNKTTQVDALIAIGLPLSVNRCLYNCAAIMQKGELLGIVPKTYLSNNNEFYEKRWFTSGAAVSEELILCGQKVPFGSLLFRMSKTVMVGVELCEDLWTPVPPSSQMALKGANIILNLSASNEVVSKNEYRRTLIEHQSAKCISAYAFSSAGVGESTTDLVFGGACYIAENGVMLAEGERFAQNGSGIYACVDVQRLHAERLKNGSFSDNALQALTMNFRIIDCDLSALPNNKIDRTFNPLPFVPADEAHRDARCREILSIQSTGLAKRLSHTGLEKVVLGISGGLDSTLALIVCLRAMKLLNLPSQNILCITMPGFGTTDRTYINALELIDAVGAQKREIDIRPACIQHMQDIGHDMNVHDITFENVQARERTQILMDIANKEGALLVGTGDLSELALGWCTYNGDQMSMYGVNAGVPKTLVRHLVKNAAENSEERIKNVLRSIFDTPVSPELLPPDAQGNIQQKTEEKIGPYELNDFFLYNFMRFGTEPQKLYFMANRAFAGKYSEEEIEKWLKLFIKRFFVSQFKRTCMPDGPKVGSVNLSPRGDWKMPSDANSEIWLEKI